MSCGITRLCQHREIPTRLALMHLPCKSKKCLDCWPKLRASYRSAILSGFPDVAIALVVSSLVKRHSDTSAGQRHNPAYRTLSRWLQRHRATSACLPLANGDLAILASAMPAGIGTPISDLPSWLDSQLDSVDKSRRITCSRDIQLRHDYEPMYKSLVASFADYGTVFEAIKAFTIDVVFEQKEMISFNVTEPDVESVTERVECLAGSFIPHARRPAGGVP